MKQIVVKGILLLLIVVVCILIVHCVKLLLVQAETERLMAEYPVKFDDLILRQAQVYELNPYLVLSIMRCESSFDPEAVSPVGARGLMQVMPDTGSWIAHKLDEEPFDADVLFDPETNIRYGCWYLSFLKRRLNGNQDAMIAGYNAGHGIVEDWLQNTDYTQQGMLVNIPYPETARYLEKVNIALAQYQTLYPDLFAAIDAPLEP